MSRGFIIAIDGPVAAGKSTLARELARELHGFYFFTGGLLRGLALYCLEHSIDVNESTLVVESMPHVVVRLDAERVFLNEIDVTQRIKEPDLAQIVSIVSAIPEVRQEMLGRWREIGGKKMHDGFIVVAEGRDVATTIFPDAAMKIFLTAAVDIRAKRRFADVKGLGRVMSLSDVIADIEARDTRDMNRKTAPLVRDPEKYGYFVIDDSHMTKTETVTMILREMKNRGLIG